MNGSLKSPMPTPVFVNEAVFSHKSSRIKSRLSEYTEPPRPPAKSAPPVSRIFKHARKYSEGPQRVSFTEKQENLESPHYNSRSPVSYFEQCFNIVGKLGHGSFGEVFKVQSKEDKQTYAVKKSMGRFRGEFDRQQRLGEVKKHERLRCHPNCVMLIKAWEEKQQLFIQTELCDMSLTDFCEKYSKIDEDIVWEILVDLTEGLKHLHDNEMVHLDIKPANVLIGLDGLYKIADFGLVLDIAKGSSEALEGDPKYLAPELLEGQFSKAADIFSLGISLLEVACDLDLPRGGDAWHQLRENQIPSDLLNGLSPDLCFLIRAMMDPKPQNRPTVDDILKEPQVIKAKNRRKRSKFYNFMHRVMKNLFYPLYFLLFWICKIFVLRPLTLLTGIKRSPEFPSYTVYNDSVLDSTLTTDESVFGSMGSPSTSGDESYILNNSLSPRNLSKVGLWQSEDSFDASPKSHSGYKMCLSKHSPWLGMKRKGSLTPPLANSSPQNYTPPSESTRRHGFHDPFVRTHVGPKNLLEVFEDAARD